MGKSSGKKPFSLHFGTRDQLGQHMSDWGKKAGEAWQSAPTEWKDKMDSRFGGGTMGSFGEMFSGGPIGAWQRMPADIREKALTATAGTPGAKFIGAINSMAFPETQAPQQPANPSLPLVTSPASAPQVPGAQPVNEQPQSLFAPNTQPGYGGFNFGNFNQGGDLAALLQKLQRGV